MNLDYVSMLIIIMVLGFLYRRFMDKYDNEEDVHRYNDGKFCISTSIPFGKNEIIYNIYLYDSI